MRKFAIILLVLITGLFSASCSSNVSQGDENSVQFYYRRDPIDFNSETGVIAPEYRILENKNDTLESLLNIYFCGPVERGFESPFPEGLYAESVILNGNRLHLTLSGVLSDLNGLDLTIACVCIEKTIKQYVDVEYVHIVFENGTSGKRNSITIGPNSYLLIDDSYISTNKEDT